MIKFFLVALLCFANTAFALEVGEKAPLFTLKNHTGVDFSLNQNITKFWTILYFYPKAETPGCTTQACAFRDAIKVFIPLNAKLYGVSTDSVEDLQKFREHHKLNFDLLSDPDAKICEAYGTKYPVFKYSKRYTFIIDPQGLVRYVDRDVDPAKDAAKVAGVLKSLQEPPFKKN